MKHQPYAPGTVLVLSSGEYDGYGIDAIVRVVKSFEARDLDGLGCGSPSEILGHLLSGGFVEHIDAQEVYVTYPTFRSPLKVWPGTLGER